MNSNDLILHAYEASPFTQKALRMLGIKQANWYFVETPMILPKPDLIALTGGYRGTPVLQIGADVYVDNLRIATELEKRIPEPSFFPPGRAGTQLAMVKWSDSFFRAGLHMVIALESKNWPAEFQQDRRDLFPDINFDTIHEDLPHARSQLRSHADLINQQLADGRDFLGGDAPSLADIHAFSVPWFTRAAMPEVNDLLKAFAHLPAWEQRIADIGEGSRTPINASDALNQAKNSVSLSDISIDEDDAQQLTAGQEVVVAPDDAQRGAVSGKVHIASASEIAIKHENESVGEVIVHFPRMGYRIVPK